MITELKPGQVFVFGANCNKTQGSGSAGFAVKMGWCKPDEFMGNCFSDNSKSYGLMTVNLDLKDGVNQRTLTADQIQYNISLFYRTAKANSDKEFLVAYTGLENTNLNGYSNEELAELFVAARNVHNNIPENVIFEEEFSTLIEKNLEKVLQNSGI